MKDLMLHAKFYIRLSPDTFRNNPTTRVLFRETYKFKIIKRDSVHGGAFVFMHAADAKCVRFAARVD